MTKRVDREGPIHTAIVDFLRTVLPDAITHHCRNEINKSGWRIAKELAQASRKGAVKGFPDLMVLSLAHIGPMFFEVKAPGNYPDATQKALHAQMAALGYRVAVVRSIDDVRAALRQWGIATKEAGSVVDIRVTGAINENDRRS